MSESLNSPQARRDQAKQHIKEQAMYKGEEQDRGYEDVAEQHRIDGNDASMLRFQDVTDRDDLFGYHHNWPLVFALERSG